MKTENDVEKSIRPTNQTIRSDLGNPNQSQICKNSVFVKFHHYMRCRSAAFF